MRGLLICLILGTQVVSAGGGVSTAGSAIPNLGEYTHRVHAVRLTLDRLAVTNTSGTTEVGKVQRELRALGQVSTSSGAVLSTGMPDLAADLAPGDQTSLLGVARQVDSIDQGLHVLPRHGADATELQLLDRVFDDPRFHPPCTPLECISNRITEFLNGLFRFLPRLGGIPPFVPWLFVLALMALVVLAAVSIARGALGRTAINILPPAPRTRAATSDDVRKRAAEAARSGDFRAALRHLFLATVLNLQEEGYLEIRPGQTNRELIRRVTNEVGSSMPNAQESLRLMVDEFDRAWYGHLPFGATDYARCQTLAEQVLVEARARPAA